MRKLWMIAVVAAVSVASGLAATAFAPLDSWKSAVIAGDKEVLAKLYSTNPPASAEVGKTAVPDLEEEWRFWIGLKSVGMSEFNPKVLEITRVPGETRLILRVSAAKEKKNMVASMVQVWSQQPDGWRLTSTRRSEFAVAAERRLPQPQTPNTSLYSDPSEAKAELAAALTRAAQEHKRLLLIFGANWCYDCHVLDTTFHSNAFGPLVDENFVVLHINVGDEVKDNTDLAARFGVALDHGIPSLAVLDPDGIVVVAQKNGEFESTVKIGPDDVRAFLEKWKPSRH